MLKILLGGSPCIFWSIGRGATREDLPTGAGWDLFMQYVKMKNAFCPHIFLYENVANMSPTIMRAIHSKLGGSLQIINSSLVSAQLRNRMYVYNGEQVPLPRDRGILMQDILDKDIAYREKCTAMTAGYYGAVAYDSVCKSRKTMVAVAGGPYEVRGGVIRFPGRGTKKILLADGFYSFRKLTVAEACRVQTWPENYCNILSSSREAYRLIGNGWTVEVIKQILAQKLAGFNRSTPLHVISMFDGAAIGRLVLDQLGFKNIKYEAYEIDKYAIQVAQSNWPDIIQKGDVFNV